METNSHPAFPHHAWLIISIPLRAGKPARVFHSRSVSHTVSLVDGGDCVVRWIRSLEEVQWTEEAGAVLLVPRDGQQHSLAIRSLAGCTLHMVLIPTQHLDGCFTDGFHARRDGDGRPVALRDPVVERCLRRLTAGAGLPGGGGDGDGDGEAGGDGTPDGAARRLVERLAEIGGGASPAWEAGAGVFQRQTIDRLVRRIDGDFGKLPSVAEMSLLVGLSPSHFARKFRNSTGFSLQRFIQRRRIRAALVRLEDQALSPADVAAAVGFASQSHFTRLFSSLTGMTPARYQAQFRPLAD